TRHEWPTGLGLAVELGESLPEGALLTTGSSNPTRDVALAGVLRPDVVLHRNRGVAGIDGTVSTAVGAASVRRGPAYARLGDLTFLHELNGLLSGSVEALPDLTIVVLNDDGGGIFSLLEQGAPQHADAFERVFGTAHGADIGSLCRGYGVPHTLARSPRELREALPPQRGPHVIEVPVDRGTHRAVHARLAAAVSNATSEAASNATSEAASNATSEAELDRPRGALAWSAGGGGAPGALPGSAPDRRYAAVWWFRAMPDVPNCRFPLRRPLVCSDSRK